MPVALEDLRRARRGRETEPLACDPLDLRSRRSVGADGARELADAQPHERAFEPLSIALELEDPTEQLQPERRRLGVHAVRSPDGDRVAMLLGTRECGLRRMVEALENQLAGALNGQRERRVEHVRRREAVVEPASVGAEIRRHLVDECGDVVVGDALALGDLRRARDARAFANGTRARGRNGSDLGPGVEGCELHGEPVLELRLLGPDPGHVRPGVAGDHRDDSSRRPTRRPCTHSARSREPLVRGRRLDSKVGGGEGWPQGHRPIRARLRCRPRSLRRSPRRCHRETALPGKEIRSAASYATARASVSDDPTPVTARIRPPFVTRRSPCSAVPA